MLKSNGRGSVFYENLTIPAPNQPTYSTDITDLNIRFTQAATNQLNVGIPFWFDAKSGDHFGCRVGSNSQASPITTGQMNFYVISKYDETVGYGDGRFIVDCTNSGTIVNSWGSLPKAHKVTLKINNYYYVAQLSFNRYADDNKLLIFDVSNVNTNIPSNNEFEANSGTAYFRKNWA